MGFSVGFAIAVLRSDEDPWGAAIFVVLAVIYAFVLEPSYRQFKQRHEAYWRARTQQEN